MSFEHPNQNSHYVYEAENQQDIDLTHLYNQLATVLTNFASSELRSCPETNNIIEQITKFQNHIRPQTNDVERIEPEDVQVMINSSEAYPKANHVDADSNLANVQF
jgi:hypothetical protein